MNDVYLQEIGRRIQNRRKRMGYTQEQLADMMNVSIQMVSNLERGNKAIRIDNLVRLSQILEISTDYILTGKENIGYTQSLVQQIARLSERDRRLVQLMIDHCLNETD